MNTLSSSTTSTGCGSGHCQCAGAAATVAAPSINGIALHAPSAQPDPATLQELAYTELLRQQAVKAGLLPRHTGLTAPQLSDAQRDVLEKMVEQAVQAPEPTVEECQRYFDAHKTQFVVGQALHVRHILFAVTPGVDVRALAAHAEKSLLSLLGKDVSPDRFTQLAAELSNCPSSTQGGDLGWVRPNDCAPELAKALFHPNAPLGLGVQPQLVHTRFGFHIVDVLAMRAGEQKTFSDVRTRIAMQLTMQSRARAWHQYMQLLVGQALIEGIDLDTADTPLVQ